MRQVGVGSGAGPPRAPHLQPRHSCSGCRGPQAAVPGTARADLPRARLEPGWVRSGCQKGAAQACGKEAGAREVPSGDWRPGRGAEREARVRWGVRTSRAAMGWGAGLRAGEGRAEEAGDQVCTLGRPGEHGYREPNRINWKILQETGTPDHLACLLRNLYAGQEATLRTGMELVPNRKRSMSRLYIVTLLI